MTSAVDPTGSLDTALAHTRRLLDANPVLAATQAGEILKVLPNHPMATLLLAVATRSAGDLAESLRILDHLTEAQPNWAQAHYERGVALAQAERFEAALCELRRAVALDRGMPDAWRAIGDLLTVSGDAGGADAAYAQHIKASTRDPRLMQAASALVEGKIAIAEGRLREHLKAFPTDVAAIRMLAEVAVRLGRNADAENLLARCLELAPSFTAARHQYAIVLHRQNKSAAALTQVAQLAQAEPHNPTYRSLQAVVLTKVGEYQESMQLYAQVLRQVPEHPKLWMSYGHTLATAGREQDSIDAYRNSIRLAPHLGEAFWSLANLKTFRFRAEETAAMRRQLARPDLADVDRYHFDFALGKALEDAGQFAESFAHYARANQQRRAGIDYEADETSAFVRRSKQLLTPDFFATRADFGSAAPDPIFILGMPRAGSTLVEQILSSHSSVEGTMELPDIIMLAAKLGGIRQPGAAPRYPGQLAQLSRTSSRELGEQFMQQTRIQRKTGKPFFIDKMPNNFLHIGLIRLILPEAKIIDVRRHPLACCFSGFKQQFAEGHRYSYSLADLGRFYRDYVELMQHFERVLPGKVLRVIYEKLVDDTEAEVRRLLEYCGLPFEDACLRFHENARPVRTASSQQVRKPIYREGLDHWRHYEPWLEPLKQTLGDVLEVYPATPQFA